MKNPKIAGITLAVLGLLLICAICPLAMNNVLVMATSGGRPQDIVSLYGQIFPASVRFGNILVSTLVITMQEVCGSVLALAVLVIGAMLAMQSRESSKKSK